MSAPNSDVEGDVAPPHQPVVRGNTLELPPPPEPSADRGIAPPIGAGIEENAVVPDADNLDVFTLAPVAALKMLCDTVETLANITGDVPPTPPISDPETLNARIVQAVKDDTTRKGLQCDQNNPLISRQPEADRSDMTDGSSSPAEHHSDVPPRAKTPIGSPEAHPTEPLRVVVSKTEPLEVQRAAITRKFYSKKPPPISLEEYLLRLHKYCPMSTAVYLATSLYIHRLAVTEQILPVTRRNVHRLLLAGLRVAMKALEDLSYPHTRFAKVGGVTESELGRLEVSFCFATDFNLRITSEMLIGHAKSVRDGQSLVDIPRSFRPVLPTVKKKTQLPLRQPMTAAKAMGAHTAA